MDPDVERILNVLQEKKLRATYAAVAVYLDVSPRSVGARLGRNCPRASWVVNARTGKPTGYFPTQLHPDLEFQSRIITSEKELRREMQ